jgi:hypothetical protein
VTTVFRFFIARAALAALVLPCALFGRAAAGDRLEVVTPMSPPAWALLERELLRTSARACLEFYDRYFDDRGYLECVERWGGDDGPDDAIENLADWPLLHALGASDEIRLRYEKAWEGHLRQYTLARTTDVDFARGGMYYKEFPVMFDWLHNAEGLTVFNSLGLSRPGDPKLLPRVRRFAGFYMAEDPGAPNYDPRLKLIRSMINGSRGPMLRKSTGLDWAGDPIEVKNRFRPGHGESSYAQMLEHFKDYNDVAGDHPQNLAATSLALNAYLLTHEPKYKAWLLGYVDAWLKRTAENGGIMPSNVGLDGVIGSAAGGRWYGGVYGWGFTVYDPASKKLASRNQVGFALVGLANAYLLTGDDRYLDVWRKQTDLINAQKKQVDGRTVYPRMFGDKGWYDYVPAPYQVGAEEIWYLSMTPTDRARAPGSAWRDFLDGRAPGYPEQALRADLEEVRTRVAEFRADTTTPDTRLSDDPMGYSPAPVTALVQLTLGGLNPGHRGSALHCRLRYFDPEARRAGLPEDVAALVESLTPGGAVLTLVNVSQTEPRTVTVQGGAYGEHRFDRVTAGSAEARPNSPRFTVRLAPGAGVRMTLAMTRYAGTPTLGVPWGKIDPRASMGDG